MDQKTIDAAKEARRAYQREWRRNNPDKVKATTMRYWAKKALQMGKEQEGSVDDR